MNRAFIFLFVLLSLQISFINGASGVAEEATTNNNKIKISVPKVFVPEKANFVEVTVTLPANTTTGDHIKFSLLSSAFPGHCNNGYFGDAYGRDDADTENQDEKPDMAFIPANLAKPEGASWENASSTEQVQSVKLIIGQDENKIPTTVVLKIQCNDYGAVAKLHAAVYNKEDETQNTTMIPVDTDVNYIADSWQEGDYNMGLGWAKNGVKWTGTADEDSEDGPDDNEYDNEHLGDGLTAFAEYRGHLVNGIHTRTHPDEKDVFIHLADAVRTPINTEFGWADNLPNIFTLREVKTKDVRNYDGADTSINFLVCSDYHRITQRAIRVLVDSTTNNKDDHIGITFHRTGSTEMQGPSRVSRIEIRSAEIDEAVTTAVTNGGINADESTIRDDIWNWVLGHEIGHALALTHVEHGGDVSNKRVVFFSGGGADQNDPMETYTSDVVLHSIMYKEANIDEETDVTKIAFGKWVVKYDKYAKYHNPWYQLVPSSINIPFDTVVQASTPMPDFANWPEQSTENNQLQPTETPETPETPPGSSQNTQPQTPTDLKASSENGQVHLSWTAPSGTVTDYEYRYRESGGSWSDNWISMISSDPDVLTDTEFFVLSLINGTTYEFQLRAVNGEIASAATESSESTPATVPGKPTRLVGDRYNQGVTLRWYPPDDDGGADVTEYQYRYSYTYETYRSWTTIRGLNNGPNSGPKRSVSIGGLTNGRQYQFQVRAKIARDMVLNH